MLSTANAKFAALVVLMLGLHIAATNLSKTESADVKSLVEKKLAITPDEPVNALLVGGSGVHYGLSAAILSEKTPFQFLNLGLIVEGNGWENYMSFLRSLPMIAHDEIELVIYSSVDIYALEESDEFTLTGARRGMLVFDKRSWLQKVVTSNEPHYGPRGVDRTDIVRETGDMIFPDGVCDFYWPAGEMPAPGDNLDEIAARAKDLQRLFPNAEVFIRPWPLSEHIGPDLEYVYGTIENGLRARGVKVLRPPKPIYDADWACDAPFHPNAIGRDMLSLQEAETVMMALSSQSAQND